MREVFADSNWARNYILIAVASGANDGTSGVQEAADQTIRREIETFAIVIFASSEAQRDFWLDCKALGPAELRETYGGPTSCLHGSKDVPPPHVGAPNTSCFPDDTDLMAPIWRSCLRPPAWPISSEIG